MSHHIPPVRISHKLGNYLVGRVLPGKKPKAPGDVVKVFEGLHGKVAQKTFRGQLSDGTPVAIHFNLVDGSVFLAMEDEVQ
ncbi:MAG: hypothetical protein AB1714_01915 [Acidobacteriota bacterium]